MKDCIFCKILNGEIPSKKIFEDDLIVVIMDINPVSNGHLLVIPKNHYEDFTVMPDELILHNHKIANQMKELLYSKLNPDGLILTNNYGCEQLVKHYHLHLIPSYLDKRSIDEIDKIYDLLTK